MTHTLSETTGTAPNGGAATAPAPVVTDFRPPVLEGFMAWLPAFVVLLGMPLLALGTTKYVLLPAMKQVFAQGAAWNGESAAGRGAASLFLAKIPLNVSGFRSLALAGTDSGFKDKIDQNKARLMDLAAGDLRGKTIPDLDKPGELDALRARLLSDLNRALGGPVVKEIYITVWP